MKDHEKYKSLLVIVIGFLVLYFWLKIDYLLYASLIVGLGSLIIPTLGDLILKGWFKIAEVLGWINTRILLSLIFFVCLTPFAWLQKLLARSNFLSFGGRRRSRARS
jgi:hypothetical protein